MAKISNAVLPPAADTRRAYVLDIAHEMFELHGYRNASMESIADAAKVSRQWIYRHFSSKENLFREMVLHVLDQLIESATAVLTAPDIPMRQRLIRAFDEWMGQFIDPMGENVAELLHHYRLVLKPELNNQQTRFYLLLVGLLAGSEQMKKHERRGVTARNLVDALYAMADGFMSRGGSRKQFTENMTSAVNTLCSLMDEDPGPGETWDSGRG